MEARVDLHAAVTHSGVQASLLLKLGLGRVQFSAEQQVLVAAIKPKLLPCFLERYDTVLRRLDRDDLRHYSTLVRCVEPDLRVTAGAGSLPPASTASPRSISCRPK